MDAQNNGQNRIDRKSAIRMWLVFGVFVLLFALVLGRLVNLMIAKGDEYRTEVLRQSVRQTVVNPDRGLIYDRNGNILAANQPIFNVIISPADIKTRMKKDDSLNSDSKADNDVLYEFSDEESGIHISGDRLDQVLTELLSSYVGAEKSVITEKLGKEDRKYELIIKDIDEARHNRLEEFITEYNISTCLYFEEHSKRYYPFGDLACHVIGFTNSEGVGIYGVEAYYNDILEGTAGKYVRSSQPMGYERFIEVQNGCNIVLSLDIYVQHELEEQLKKTFTESEAANRVCGIVMDVTNGEIIAMATYPSFDLNDPYTLDEYSLAELESYGYREGSEEYGEMYTELLFRMWNNKAVMETYEPGSTFKVISTAMAFEENVVSEYDYFTCAGYLYIEGWDQPIKCANEEGHGTVTFKYGLQQSCNPTIMQVTQLVGKDRFYDYFKLFGYTETTGVDLPGESGGIYSSRADFTKISLAVYSFGQTFKTTPIQQLRALSAIANGGNLLTPHVMQKIVDSSGETLGEYGSAFIRRVATEKTCERITAILEEGVATDGAANNAYVKGYKVAAKTGTSEKLDKYDEYGERPYRVGSTIAYAPADEPKYSALIMVDEPMSGIVYGGSVAAPYISSLLSEILPYLGVEPRYTTDELAALDVLVSGYVGASVEDSLTDLSWRNFRYEIRGSGAYVTAQFPEAGSRISSDTGVLILYTDEDPDIEMVEVPNVIGLSAYNANSIATGAGFNVTFSGSTNGTTATVISQYPEAGTEAPRGTVMSIELRYMDGLD